VEEFADRLGLRNVTLVMQDWGGPIGAALATRRPELVSGLVFGNTFLGSAKRRPVAQLFSRTLGGPIGRAIGDHYNGVAQILLTSALKGRRNEIKEMYLAPFAQPGNRRALNTFARSTLASDDWLRQTEARLPGIANKPALFVWGGQDTVFFNRATLAGLQARFRSPATVFLPEAGYWPQEDAPDVFADAITRWHPATRATMHEHGPVTPLTRVEVQDYDRLLREKRAALTRFGRTPSEITERMLPAPAWSHGGVSVDARRIFTQIWRAKADPRGVVVMAPGYGRSGRDFLALADRLSRWGFEVWLMDQQWTGHSDGEPGQLDSVWGVARDLAAVAGAAQKANPSQPMVLVGASLSGMAAALLRTAPASSLAVKHAVLLAPFFAPTEDKELLMKAVKWLPPVAVGATLSAPLDARFDRTPSQPVALARMLDQVAALRPTLEQAGNFPMTLVHSRGDTIADIAATRELAQAVNRNQPGQARLIELDGVRAQPPSALPGADALHDAFDFPGDNHDLPDQPLLLDYLAQTIRDAFGQS
jgi:pimeloyl-ACP methyl ester carboxylesterase